MISVYSLTVKGKDYLEELKILEKRGKYLYSDEKTILKLLESINSEVLRTPERVKKFSKDVSSHSDDDIDFLLEQEYIKEIDILDEKNPVYNLGYDTDVRNFFRVKKFLEDRGEKEVAKRLSDSSPKINKDRISMSELKDIINYGKELEEEEKGK